MSKAKSAFEDSIRDAEELLAHFDAINRNPPPENAEVLKRAGLVMALTAWETYVEDRLREEMQTRLRVVNGSQIGSFVLKRMEEELKRFHNPNSDKSKRLFVEYLGIDVTSGWSWNGCDRDKAQKTLDDLIGKRGDAVHRSRPPASGLPQRHLVKRDELDKCIAFLRRLVDATDAALE